MTFGVRSAFGIVLNQKNNDGDRPNRAHNARMCDTVN